MDQNVNRSENRSALVNAVAKLDEDTVMALVKARIESGENPFTIVEDCRAGMQVVGEHYEKRDYFLSALIMAGEIFKEVMQLLEPIIVDQYRGNELGLILLGTVAGDIHDIGKNILSMLLTSYGFTVHDMGVDVPAEDFLNKAREIRPDIIALSGLLTSSFESMKETIEIIRNQGDAQVAKTPIVIGGSTIDQHVCQYVGADHWANDAMVGVRLFKQMLEEKHA